MSVWEKTGRINREAQTCITQHLLFQLNPFLAVSWPAQTIEKQTAMLDLHGTSTSLGHLPKHRECTHITPSVNLQTKKKIHTQHVGIVTPEMRLHASDGWATRAQLVAYRIRTTCSHGEDAGVCTGAWPRTTAWWIELQHQILGPRSTDWSSQGTTAWAAPRRRQERATGGWSIHANGGRTVGRGRRWRGRADSEGLGGEGVIGERADSENRTLSFIQTQSTVHLCDFASWSHRSWIGSPCFIKSEKLNRVAWGRRRQIWKGNADSTQWLICCWFFPSSRTNGRTGTGGRVKNSAVSKTSLLVQNIDQFFRSANS